MTEVIGKRYSPVTYAVGREKIREYANAVGETNPLYTDVDVAHAAGYPDLVAPPMFAAVYTADVFPQALLDPELGIDAARLVHGAQEFHWSSRVVVAGDELTTDLVVKNIYDRPGLRFYVFESVSTEQLGTVVCVGIWTHIVREP